MRTSIFLLISWLIWTSCSNEPTGSEIISKDKFVDVLVDIHLADATLLISGMITDRDSTKIKYYYNTVLKKHEVTQKQIDNTFAYYTKNPRKFEKLYEQVSERIVKLEEQPKDSLQN